MKPAVEAAFAQRLNNVGVFEEENPRQFDFAAEEAGRHQRHGHDLGAAHTRLRVVLIAHGFERIIAQAINEGNGILHGGLPVAETTMKDTITRSEAHTSEL